MQKNKKATVGPFIVAFVGTIIIFAILIGFFFSFSLFKAYSDIPSSNVDSRVLVDNQVKYSSLNSQQFNILMNCEGQLNNEKKSFYEAFYLFSIEKINEEAFLNFLSGLPSGCYYWVGIEKKGKQSSTSYVCSNNEKCKNDGALNSYLNLLKQKNLDYLYLERDLFDCKIYISSENLESEYESLLIGDEEVIGIDYG